MTKTSKGNNMGLGMEGTAMDVTYSTKLDNQIQWTNYGVGSFAITSYDNNLKLCQNIGSTTITLETNIINDYQTLDLVVQWQ